MDSQKLEAQPTNSPEINQKLENTMQKVRRKLLYFFAHFIYFLIFRPNQHWFCW